MVDQSEAPGWDAIDRVMVGLHGPQEPVHWLLDPTMGLDGPRLEGLSAYCAGDHWHLVTLGLTEIWTKQTDDPLTSGLGFEFTMRVPRSTGSRWRRGQPDRPPDWAVWFMQRLGDVTLQGGRFRPGETLDPGGRITGDTPSRLVAAAFVDDPTLPVITTPNGAVSFVQVFGITADELDAVCNGDLVVESMAGSDGLFVTDPRR
jgi:hypothetical protein